MITRVLYLTSATATYYNEQTDNLEKQELTYVTTSPPSMEDLRRDIDNLQFLKVDNVKTEKKLYAMPLEKFVEHAILQED